MPISKRLALVCLAALLWTSSAFAQAAGGIPTVQLNPTPLYQVTCQNNNAAVNNAVTLTITVPNGLYAYFVEWDMQTVENGTATAQTNVKFTTTNLNGVQYQYSTPATANATVNFGPFTFALFPVKSQQPGVNVTFVSPALAAQAAYNINACYYFAQ